MNREQRREWRRDIKRRKAQRKGKTMTDHEGKRRHELRSAMIDATVEGIMADVREKLGLRAVTITFDNCPLDHPHEGECVESVTMVTPPPRAMARRKWCPHGHPDDGSCGDCAQALAERYANLDAPYEPMKFYQHRRSGKVHQSRDGDTTLCGLDMRTGILLRNYALVSLDIMSQDLCRACAHGPFNPNAPEPDGA